MIDDDTKGRIMDAVRIEEVISDFVSLQKRGANYVACCPFHDEKTPSFSVSPTKGIYKCFGCGKSGDAVTFLMDHEHYSYPETLRYLAGKYHIEIKEEELTEEQKEQRNERDALFNLSDFAQKYFADTLYHNEMGTAVGLSYLHQRGLTDEVIKKFGLGYCLEDWRAFTDHARSQGYSDAMLQKTGLTIFHDDGKCYDRFRGRVMFPLYNLSGRVTAFSGRVLKKDANSAKYINSPESEIYTKGKNLYGLYQARSAIVKADKCYLVEGNIDVVSMFQSGVENTVASWGTSLTDDQIHQVKRFTSNITVVYDGDAAGIHATLRAVDMLYRQGLHVRVVLFPDNEDPDSYAQKYGSTRLQEFLSQHEEDFLTYRLRLITEQERQDPILKTQVLKEILRTVALVPDLLERSQYLSLCASRFGMQEAVLQKELAQIMAQNAKKRYEEAQKEAPAEAQQVDVPTPQVPTVPQAPPALNQDELQERKIISLLVNYGSTQVNINYLDRTATASTPVEVQRWITDEITDEGLTFTNPLYQQVFDIFEACSRQGQYIDGRHLMRQGTPQQQALAATLMAEDNYQLSEQWKKKRVYIPTIEDNLARDVDESLLHLKMRKLNRMMADLQTQMQQATALQDEAAMARLIEQKMQMDALKQQIGHRLNHVITY